MRDVKLDFLRSIGLILIILAHVNAPNWLVQVRCFDVPLMIFVSGLVSKSNIEDISQYFYKRTARLLFPVYGFITFLFLGYWLASLLGIFPLMENFPQVVFKTYILSTTEGLGYVWIFRVFLLMMLITPIILKVIKTLKGYVLLILCFILSGLLNISFVNSNICKSSVILTELFRDILQYIFGYGLILSVAIRYKSADFKERRVHLLIVSILLVLSIVIYYKYHGLPIQISQLYKYPPQFYFLIYGLFCSIFLCSVLDTFPECITKNKLLVFIGQNTIWIYLWHIPFISISEILFSQWYIKWLFVLSISILIYYIQYKMVKNKPMFKSISKYLIG